jgi:hypothetical protein
MVGSMVNATVSRAPITFVEVQGGADPTWYVAHCAAGEPAAMPLENGRYLFLFQLLGLRRPEKYLTTLSYSYSYQATEDENSWTLRYDYVREPPPGYRYPRFHVHVSASPTSYRGPRSFPDLHLPTGRVTIEELLRHLVREHAIGPISGAWETTLREAEEFFEEIQRKRFA